MRNRVAGAVLVALLTLTAGQAPAANDELDELRSSGRAADEWRVIRQDKAHNLTAYDKRDIGKRLRSFRVEAESESDLNTMAQIWFDFPNYPKWFYQVQEAKLLHKVSSTEFYYYIIHNAPPTLPDRDAVIHVTILPYNTKRGYALLTFKSIPDYLPPKPPLVRMIAEDMTIKWTPIGNKVRGVVEGFIDPGGYSPSWAVNYVQRNAPYLTALGFRRMHQASKSSGTKAEPAFTIME